jgi:hypothetical protein
MKCCEYSPSTLLILCLWPQLYIMTRFFDGAVTVHQALNSRVTISQRGQKVPCHRMGLIKLIWVFAIFASIHNTPGITIKNISCARSAVKFSGKLALDILPLVKLLKHHFDSKLKRFHQTYVLSLMLYKSWHNLSWWCVELWQAFLNLSKKGRNSY